MAFNLRKAFYSIGSSIEEIILFSIIILNILDFAQLLSPDLDYIKKIISWTALGYLLYKAGLTEIFFGEKHKGFDMLLILSYFSLSFKNMFGYASSTIKQLEKKGSSYWANLFSIESTNEISQSAGVVDITSPVKDVDLNTLGNIPIGEGLRDLVHNLSLSFKGLFPEPNTLVINISNEVSSRLFLVEPKYIVHRWLNLLLDPAMGWSILYFSILLGALMLVFMAFYFTLRFNIKEPSLMHVIHQEGPPVSLKNPIKFLKRFLIILLVLNFFFVVVFNLMMEWLAIAIDAPLLVIGLLFYLMLWIKHHQKFSTESIVYKLGNMGEEFYSRFISLFHSKKGLVLAISGTLVFHLLTDIGNFLVPYITGIYNSLYFEQLGPGHNPVFSFADILSAQPESLIGIDLLSASGVLSSFGIILVYLLNIVGVLFLLIIPAAIWFFIFSKKEFNIPSWLLPLYFSSVACFLIAPVFIMKRINSPPLVGVDIITQSLLENSSISIKGILLICALIWIAVFLLAKKSSLNPYLIYTTIITSLIFFAYYIFIYFMDISSYYAGVVLYNYKQSEYFIAGYFFIIFMLSIVFYAGGFMVYLYELVES